MQSYFFFRSILCTCFLTSYLLKKLTAGWDTTFCSCPIHSAQVASKESISPVSSYPVAMVHHRYLFFSPRKLVAALDDSGVEEENQSQKINLEHPGLAWMEAFFLPCIIHETLCNKLMQLEYEYSFLRGFCSMEVWFLLTCFAVSWVGLGVRKFLDWMGCYFFIFHFSFFIRIFDLNLFLCCTMALAINLSLSPYYRVT